MLAGINQQTGAKRSLIDWAVKSKFAKLDDSGTFTHAIYDKLVFKKFRDILGGRVRIMVTGSAPISKETVRFLKIAFCWEIFEAYGQTETTGGSFFTDPFDNIVGHVGGPSPSNEFKLVDVPEMSYHSTDTILYNPLSQPHKIEVILVINIFIIMFFNDSFKLKYFKTITKLLKTRNINFYLIFNLWGWGLFILFGFIMFIQSCFL